MTLRRNMLFIGSALSLIASAALAADPDKPEQGIEEITVTAQKRTENLQLVPIAVQVVSGQVLSETNENSLRTLSQTVPGVYIQTLGPGNEIFIRGIGSEASASFDQSAAIFEDDIFHGRSRMSQAAFLDVDHLEVLKGPQSTFFGNNAIAGALNVVSRKPNVNEWEGWARVLYGSYDTYAVEGAAGGPVSDQFAFRIAGTVNGNGGWIDNVVTNKKIPVNDNQVGRVTLLYHPTDDFDATLKIEGGHTKTSGANFDTPNQIIVCPPIPPFGAPGPFCALALANHRPIGLDINEAGALPGTGWSLTSNEAVLTLNYHVGDHTLTSVTGHSGYDSNNNFDSSSSGLPLVTAELPERYDQYSQEFRVASPTGGLFEYLAGVYVQTDSLHFKQAIDFFVAGPGPTGPSPAQQYSDHQHENSYAAFGSLSWNATEALKLSFALRGTWVDKDFDYNVYYGPTANLFDTVTAAYPGALCTTTSAATGLQAALGKAFGTPACSFHLSRSDHDWLPSAKIQYQFSDQAMAYARWDRGFKSGGFNGTDSTGIEANLPFAPEDVTAYEVGIKSKWFNNTLLLNADLFRSEYSNLQVASFHVVGPVTTTVVQNAASSISQGVEAEVNWVPDEHFRFKINAAYIDAHYVQFPDGPASQLQQLQTGSAAANLAGYRITPRWTGSFSASYGFALPQDWWLTMELSPYFTSDYRQDILDRWTGSYVRLDARVSVESPDGHWAVDLIGKNLSDLTILEKQGIADTLPNGFGSQYGNKYEPINISGQIRYKF